MPSGIDTSAPLAAFNFGAAHGPATLSFAREAAAGRPQPPMLFNGEAAPVSFVVHKIVQVARAARGLGLAFVEVERRLAHAGFRHVDLLRPDLLGELQGVGPRINVDQDRLQIAYVNPFDKLQGQEQLLETIGTDGSRTGLRVTQDLLDANTQVALWINSLLAERKVRGIRLDSSNIKGKTKCKFAGTSQQCNIYASTKCAECFRNLLGILLYPLGDPEHEDARIKLDPDMRTIWNQIELPPTEDILREYNVASPTRSLFSAGGRGRKKRANGDALRGMGRNARMRRIHNTHLFTAQELRENILQGS
eukprot:GHVT01002791.1.p1 GENE.GHVT01002791.1~~GHVT01002791.1.p1  ORF type:complete len:307 (+),score=58.82 GHVT01002791.1:520-1440(+)